MTNGEKIKQIFPELQIDEGELEVYMWTTAHDAIDMPLEWWEAEYKEPASKNDLGVDWESYKDADGNSLDDLILEVLQNNFDCGNTYGYKVADEIIELLPSVTPQPKHGIWQQIKKNEVNVIPEYKCSECGAEYKGFGFDFDYCPRCGSFMEDEE